MSIQIWGDVTEEEYEYYKKNHKTVIIEGNIITKAEREAKDKIEQQKVLKAKKIEMIHNSFMVVIFIMLLAFCIFLLSK